MSGKGYLEVETFWLFEVGKTNQSSKLGEMVTDYPYAIEHKIRVIGYAERKWHIDPPTEDIRSHWKLWVLAKQPFF